MKINHDKITIILKLLQGSPQPGGQKVWQKNKKRGKKAKPQKQQPKKKPVKQQPKKKTSQEEKEVRLRLYC